jgi:AcrR family transcriptional regulator
VNRARSAEAKLVRREQILLAAVDLLVQEPYEQVTMAAIARSAGLAKGTAYLYWSTKEGLFLEALQAEYAGLLGDLARAIPELPAEIEPLASAIAEGLAQRPRLLAMIGLLHAVLERNAPVDAVITFKRSVLAGVLEVAAALHQRLPWLSIEEAARLQLRIHGAIVAFRQMADPPEGVRQALEQPDLALMRVDIERDLRDLIRDLLIAAHARGEHG